MAEYTTNYQLHQWAADDDFLRTDFNEDLAKIDTAIKGVETAAAQALTAYKTSNDAAVANCGNCSVVTGTYTGTGTYGSSNPTTLSLNLSPKIVWIFCDSYGSGSYDWGSSQYNPPMGNDIKRFLKGGSKAWGYTYIAGTGYRSTAVTYTMGTNTFSCYCENDAGAQMNAQGQTYYYVAIG